MHKMKATLLDLASSGHLTCLPPGHGQTAERHAALYEVGRQDLSLARLAEAHLDAHAIFTEAGRTASAGLLYGVWASDGPSSLLTLYPDANGGLRLNGVKRYCSGALLLDAALVTAHRGEEVYLVDVRLNASSLTTDVSDWASPAFQETATATVMFNDVVVREQDILGGANWYLTRPGFWHGALGPAACWAGGAAGLVDAARLLNRRDPHSRAQLGALEAADWALRALLRQAGEEIDADPEDGANQARRRALMARHVIERTCTDVLDRFGRATGPQLLAFDRRVAQRHAELTLYIRQCHAERDLASIPVEELPRAPLPGVGLSSSRPLRRADRNPPPRARGAPAGPQDRR
jgi:alkylation response protein AidB-like acyl-CoA dehydrogenase